MLKCLSIQECCRVALCVCVSVAPKRTGRNFKPNVETQKRITFSLARVTLSMYVVCLSVHITIMPAILRTETLDLLVAHEHASADVIVQQLNCLTVRPHGLSESIAHRWKWADVYGSRKGVAKMNLAVREDRAIPGTLHIRARPSQCDAEEEQGPRFVANLMAQYEMGIPGRYDYTKYMTSDVQRGYVLPPPDTSSQRESWFRLSVRAFAQWCLNPDNAIRVIAIPDHIGCGLAAGNWQTYQEILQEELVKPLPDAVHVIMCKEPAQSKPTFQFPIAKVGTCVTSPMLRTTTPAQSNRTLEMFFQRTAPGASKTSTNAAAAAVTGTGVSTASLSAETTTTLGKRRRENTDSKVKSNVAREKKEMTLSVMMTGSREWNGDVSQWLEAMVDNDELLKKAAAQKNICLNHGNARGADRSCASWASRQGWKVRAFEPDWDKYRRLGRPKAAGVMRNQEMLDQSRPQYVIAFLKQRSRGTLDALARVQSYAAQHNSSLVQVTIVEDDGSGHLSSRTMSRTVFKTAKL